MEYAEDKYDMLMARYLAGETTAPESRELNDWITVSDENKKRFDDARRIFDLTGTVAEIHPFDTGKAWNKLKKRTEPVKKQTVIRRIFVSYYSRAAAILVFAGISYYMYYRYQLSVSPVTLVASSSAPLSITLPDGSFVSLGKNSTLIYGSRYNEKDRELQLDGEAYFRVSHGTIPFIVKSGNVFVKDIGTAFSVTSNPGDSVMTVQVTEGKVVFYTNGDPGMQLAKDETGIYNRASRQFRKKEKPADANYRELKFVSATLRSVVDTINSRFNTHIVLSCNEIENLKLTATFIGGLPATETTINSIVATIAETFSLTVIRTQESVYLESKACKNSRSGVK